MSDDVFGTPPRPQPSADPCHPPNAASAVPTPGELAGRMGEFPLCPPAPRPRARAGRRTTALASLASAAALAAVLATGILGPPDIEAVYEEIADQVEADYPGWTVENRDFTAVTSEGSTGRSGEFILRHPDEPRLLVLVSYLQQPDGRWARQDEFFSPSGTAHDAASESFPAFFSREYLTRGDAVYSTGVRLIGREGRTIVYEVGFRLESTASIAVGGVGASERCVYDPATGEWGVAP